jgi:hypothetical protein
LARPGQSLAPRRLLVVSHCHGWPYDGWRLRPPGLDDTTPFQLDLASVSRDELSAPLAELYEHRSRMIALDGLSLATAELDAEGNRHDKGWVHAWTGHNADFGSGSTRSHAASLDQLVAAAIARPDRLPSLELAIDGGPEAARPISYAANGVQLPQLNTPDLAWQRMFGPSLGDVGLAARQRSVLDYAYGEYTTVAPSLTRTARQRLQAHFSLLRTLGDRIEGMAALECPETPALVGSLDNYDARFDTFADLITVAFSCDITRVVTLSMAELPTIDFGADDLTDDVHKGLAHEIYNDPAKHDAMVNHLTHQSAQLARLLSSLEAMPDLDGRSVLDNTLVVWGSELANGWHGYKDYCATLFGGSWVFPGGRYVRMPHDTPIQLLIPASDQGGGYTDTSGRPHQHLLVSAAQAMGLETDAVGLHQVQGQDGQHVSLRGPLPELTETR